MIEQERTDGEERSLKKMINIIAEELAFGNKSEIDLTLSETIGRYSTMPPYFSNDVEMDLSDDPHILSHKLAERIVARILDIEGGYNFSGSKPSTGTV
ncbi:hypothetical protein GX888_02635 [Candidatus Dojkabacteria bacterium]|uniref:Uncharacterized protein n=1 Tax=Candidatus Dojkabacteria bacterium TaxID=2099670 RepID=A0A847VDJ9_9BACT|nr:hypothetical protein [Candidatus Dojkabacteria bacterium]